MKTILLVGAGKSATTLIQYLLKRASLLDWKLLIADANLAIAEEKAGSFPYSQAVQLNVQEAAFRQSLVQQADLVISLLPPSLHIQVANDCLAFGKPLFTASYIDPAVRQLAPEIEKKGLLFLYEMGLDPGLDHMSIMALLKDVKVKGGVPISLLSHCGGLVAHESDNNPWHYKISWNPSNVVQAGKMGARYKWNGEIVNLAYADLFSSIRSTKISETETLAWYPNRDSLSYLSLYGLESIATFVRTTLRHPTFMRGWNQLIQLQLTADTPCLPAQGDSYAVLLDRFLKFYSKQDVFKQLTATDTTLKLLFESLGFYDNATLAAKESLKPAAFLQSCLENYLKMMPTDKDRIIMQHELVYMNAGKKYKTTSTLDLTGLDATNTAMAKTVGLPLALATELYLNGKLNKKGLLIPVQEDFYIPILPLLQKEGISFIENTMEVTT